MTEIKSDAVFVTNVKKTFGISNTFCFQTCAFVFLPLQHGSTHTKKRGTLSLVFLQLPQYPHSLIDFSSCFFAPRVIERDVQGVFEFAKKTSIVSQYLYKHG